MNDFTVIGQYDNGKTVVVHAQSESADKARRAAVQQIAFEVYDGSIQEGLAAMNEAIGQVSEDFKLVAILEGHANPIANHKAPHIFHGSGESND